MIRARAARMSTTFAEACALREAADALEFVGTCGQCGREVHATLKPICGDCAGVTT